MHITIRATLIRVGGLARMLALAGALAAIAGGPARALDGYTIRDVAVDVTAVDAVTARSEAMAQAQRVGLGRLMDRLSGGAAPARLPAVGTLDMDRLVRSIDVEEEQLASTRYIAKLTVTYDKPAIDDLLQAARAPMILRPADPLLIVPVIDRGQGPEWWPLDEAWRGAWQNGDVGIGLLDLRLPTGDAADQAILSADALATDPDEPLRRLAARHGAGSAVVLLATPVPSVDATPIPSPGASPETPTPETPFPEALDVTLLRAVDWDAPQLGGRFVADSGDVFAQAAAAAAGALEEDWQERNLVRLDNLATVSLRVPIDGLRDWVGIRRGMEALPEIREIVVERLSQEEAVLELRYVGGQDALFRALDTNGLRVLPEADGWRLQRAEVRGTPSRPALG